MVRKLTTEEVKQRIYSLEGDNYELLSDYVNARTKIKVKHSLCGCVYEVFLGNFQQGCRCPKCNGNHIYTDEGVSRLVSDMTDGEYIKLSEYKNNYTPFKIRHEKCNFEYEVRWKDFRIGGRCPKCSSSKGEKFIEDYLTNQGISFATQVRFDDCRYKKPLPFDFAILDDNKRIICLIEYDGEQHYKSVDFFGGEEALQQTQLRDQIKNQYCKDNNIPLLRIRFDEENILKVIEEFIAQEKVS